MNNLDNENDVDKILGMNRTLFFLIVILLCVLSLSIGIYAQFFYRYSDTDPYMLGIGVGATQEAAEITRMKNEFNNIFTNEITGTTTNSIIKIENDKELVYTIQTVNEQDEEKNYNISANIPKININSNEVERINAELRETYQNQINEILNDEIDADYSVSYRAYLNGDLLSLIVKETIHSGQTPQSAKIKTYNYNIVDNKKVTINDIIVAKKYNKQEMQAQINKELEELNQKDKSLEYSTEIRNLKDYMYQIENTENFLVDNNGYVYIIYAYGNTKDTNKMDLVIFE